jgi:hypothetical protein
MGYRWDRHPTRCKHNRNRTLGDFMNTSYADLPNAIMHTLQSGLVPMLHGSPGCGKSDIVRKIAQETKLKVIDVRLSQLDPTDISGFPSLVNGRSEYLPPKIFPIKGDEIPSGYEGFLLFLDEINSAPLAVQAAAYRLVLDREVGQHKLHSNVAIIAAGNKSTDKAIVNRMSTAMQSRMVHFNIEPDAESWIKWANKADIDYRVIGFIEFRPELLFKFDPHHSDNTFPTPRTWHFISKLIQGHNDIKPYMLPMFAGTVGEGPAIEFNAFLELFGKIPKFSEILVKGATLEIPDKPDMLYAISSMLIENINENNISKAIIYLSRLPIEFQITCFKTAVEKNPKLIRTTEFKDWTKTHAKYLIQ